MVRELKESYHLTSVEDILDGYVGNVDDSQMDSDIKMWTKFSKLLGSGKWYTHVSVLVDGDGEYDPAYYGSSPTQQKSGWKMYDINGIKVISEYRNGINFLYFKDDSDANTYVGMVDKINNPDEVTEDLELNEAVEVPTNDYLISIYFDFDDDISPSGLEYDDLKDIDRDEVEGCRDDAIRNFYSNFSREVENLGVDIKNALGIEDFSIEMGDIDSHNELSVYFSTSSPIDISEAVRKLEPIADECEGTSETEFDFVYDTGRRDYSPYYPSGGIPDYDEMEVSYSTGAYPYGIDIKEV